MKKVISLFIIILAAFGCLAACGQKGGTSSSSAVQPGGENGRVRIVATTFPIYDWVKNILGENPADIELTLLLDKGVDLHSYQPTVDDIMQVSSSDLFLYVGGESDQWVQDALKEVVNPNQLAFSLLDLLGDQAKEEEEKEGMQAEAGEEEEAIDEHVWLSLRNAALFTDKIRDALSSLDPANAEVYKANADAYQDQLLALDQEYQDTVSSAKRTTLLFGDRFPFRYLTDDYGLDYYAAFAGCSAETEASFKTILFLAGKVDELSLPVVLTIEGSDGRIADTIVQNTKTKDQKILSMDSMQSVTAKEVVTGATYLSIMQENLKIIKEALN